MMHYGSNQYQTPGSCRGSPGFITNAGMKPFKISLSFGPELIRTWLNSDTSLLSFFPNPRPHVHDSPTDGAARITKFLSTIFPTTLCCGRFLNPHQ